MKGEGSEDKGEPTSVAGVSDTVGGAKCGRQKGMRVQAHEKGGAPVPVWRERQMGREGAV